MVQQPVINKDKRRKKKYWKCTKKKINEKFITTLAEEARRARKQGFTCKRIK